MKKLILLELAFLFLATTFSSDSPPGWYQQTLPVSDQINDIFFLDSLKGWAVTDSQNGTTDSSYIMRTTNGGNNWEIDYRTFVQFTAIQFANSEVGYACGISSGPELFKSTNGGVNWNVLNVLTFTWKSDLSFINKDTGWVCSSDAIDGGVFRTNDGGQSWQQQLNLGIGNPLKIFFVNKDTGWFSNDFEQLYKTTNGGMNWNGIFTSASGIDAIFFLNGQKGWMRGGSTGTSGISYTIDGGFNWIGSDGNTLGGFDVQFINDSVGYAGTLSYPRIMKSTDGGKIWGYQIGPTGSDRLVDVIKNDILNAWAGQLIHTKDGGGELIITDISENNNLINKNFFLFQNYPNPFNPVTNLEFGISKLGFISLKVYDIQGKEITTIVNSKLNPGTYKYEFNGSNLNSGVYFYVLRVTDEKSGQIFSEAKNMVLVK